MTPIVWLLVVWGLLTTILIVLLIYRSTLSMHEDDQLFLGESEAHMEKEQVELLKKMERLSPILRWMGAASGTLLIVIAGLEVYRSLNSPTP